MGSTCTGKCTLLSIHLCARTLLPKENGVEIMYELKVIVEGASKLAASNQELFAMIRREGFGASDSSVLLGVNPFPDGKIDKLIEQKRSPVVTEAEMAIGRLVNVRKGSDLEPIIMRKFEEQFKLTPDRLIKPDDMYRIGDTPLTVNYDGILELPPYRVAVECKYVSAYGGKYYKQEKAVQQGKPLPLGKDLEDFGVVVDHVYLMKRAEEAGIPIYYYTQIQQQLLGLNAPWGYLAALFDKDWELYVFLVMADPKVQHLLVQTAEREWAKI
jgi:hypothetical protein